MFFVTVAMEIYKRFTNTCLGRERNPTPAIATAGCFVSYGSFRESLKIGAEWVDEKLLIPSHALKMPTADGFSPLIFCEKSCAEKVYLTSLFASFFFENYDISEPKSRYGRLGG